MAGPRATTENPTLREPGCLSKLRAEVLPSVELLGKGKHTPAPRCPCMVREQVQSKWRTANQMYNPNVLISAVPGRCRKERGGLGAVTRTQSLDSHNTSAHATGIPCAKCHATS